MENPSRSHSIQQPSGPGFGELARSVAPVAGPLLQLLFPSPPTPLDILRERLLEIQITKELEGAALPVVKIEWAELIPDGRQDLVCVGARGSGKTAFCAGFGQELSARLGLEFSVLGWPAAIADKIGASVVTDLVSLRDRVVFVDEAGVLVPAGKRQKALYQAVTLARHRNVSILWSAQTLSGLHRDVLRSDCWLAFKRQNEIAARFDREEALDLLAQVRTLQVRFPELGEPAWTTVIVDGGYHIVEAPLPSGWDDSVSRLWR